MIRRQLLSAGASGVLAALAGCNLPTGGDAGGTTTGPTTTSTSTSTARRGRTVTIGPSSPNCPEQDGSSTWGLMEKYENRYDASVTSGSDARELVRRVNDDDRTVEYRVVTPRPDRVEWKGSTVDVTREYGTDNWHLLLPEKRHDEAGVLVVGTGSTAVVVRFFVGAC